MVVTNGMKPNLFFQLIMLSYIEPGYYKAGGFGIRTENILVVVKKHDGKFLGFENVTLCPYERELLDHSQLTKADVDYINEYHERVRNFISLLAYFILK